MTLELAPHQIKAIKELDNGKILVGGTGVGKSRTAVGYYLERESPRDVIVITTAKKRDSLDWEREFVAAGVYKTADTTRHGILTVDSWNNIERYKDVKDAFFILDEQRIVGSGSWSQSFLRIARQNRWILLSATPGDNWLDYIPVFVANGYYKNRTDFKRQHCVFSYYGQFPKLDRYIDVNRLVRLRNNLLVEMPYLRSTVRHTSFVDIEYDKELMDQCQTKRWNVFESRPLKDIAELFRVSRKIANTNESRSSELTILLTKHPRVIVFYNFDYELELLRNSVKTLQEKSSKEVSDLESKTTNGLSSKELGLAEWNGHKHQEIPNTLSWVYLVQFQSGSEGWNCTTTDAMYMYSLPYSYKCWHQAFGRIDRMDTPYIDLYYYIAKSSSWIDDHIWRALSTKQSFNESKSVVKW